MTVLSVEEFKKEAKKWPIDKILWRRAHFSPIKKRQEIIEWCNEYATGKVFVSGGTIWFENKEDLAFFILVNN